MVTNLLEDPMATLDCAKQYCLSYSGELVCIIGYKTVEAPITKDSETTT